MSNKKKTKRNPFRMFKTNLTVSIVLGIILMLIMFSAVADVIGYSIFSHEFTNEYSDNAFRIADAAESYINPDHLDEYLASNGDSEEYSMTYSLLNTLCNRVNAQFIYVIRPSDDYEQITFIFNTVNANSGFEPYPIGYVRETTNDEYKEKYMLLMNNESEKELVVRDKGLIESGSHITAMKALHRTNGSVAGILCVQRQMEAMSSARFDYFINMMIASGILIFAFSMIFIIYLRHWLISPLRLITNESERFAATPTPSEIQLSNVIRLENEIGVLAKSVEKMETNTLDYIENITAMTAEQHRIGTELSVASSIQQGMLNAVSPDREEFDIIASMTPAKEVGGDFYDFFMIDDDHLCMVMADVSGKGVPAAMFMTVTKVLLNDASMVLKSPSDALRYVNNRICKKNTLDMFVTVWLGILEISTGIITAANAGHEYPAVFKNGEAFELLKDPHGFVIGGIENLKYRNYTIELKKGDSLFLYTDGLCEATNAEEELFGSERMIQALNLNPSASPDVILETVKKEVDSFVGDVDPFDDLTMMCLKFYGKK